MEDINQRDTGELKKPKVRPVDIPKVDLQQTDKMVVPEQLKFTGILSRPEKTNGESQ